MAIKIEVFKTDSCPHCPAAVSAAENAKAKFGDQIDVEIVNANDPANIDRAREYRIMAVPTVVIDGEVVFIGAPSDDELIEKLESLL
ncbi:thioredoxin family protein [Methanobrevibacter millerae]|uniref:Small redox-active disulfide protein 1 n=1 Tax=Methanobrevibacter millerae TaxID=230361 RepID=A0A1G5UXJ1_9EURY|nr:thioredoxin family protein [Methanobrevibacter millerae]SDA37475.1 small redox-active disulfide protein 1 [Methanobrevibacter millerae]